MRPYESDGLTAYRQLPMVVVLPETTEQVARVLRYCHDERHQGGAARRRHLALGRRAAARRRRAARHGQVQPHPARSTSTTASPWSQPGVTNLGDHRRRSAHAGLLLRARSVLADRLHHRRQRRGEFRRRALPEIRPDHQQRARLRDRADRPARSCASAASISTPPATTCSADHRLGRPARRRHRGHRAHPARSRRPRARVLVGFAVVARTPANASPTSSAPASFRAAWR